MDRVSIIIPVYNKEPYLEDLCRSIDKQVCTDEFDIELLMADDCSDDNSLEYIRNYEFTNPSIKRVEIFDSTKRSGPAVQFNKLLDETSGEYIIPFDADDIFTRLSTYSRYRSLKDNADADWSTGAIMHIYDDNKFRTLAESNKFNYRGLHQGQELLNDLISRKIGISAQSVAYKSKVLKALRWNDNLSSSQDSDLYIRSALMGYKLLSYIDYVALYRYRSKSSLFVESRDNGRKVIDFETIIDSIKDRLTEEQIVQLETLWRDRFKEGKA